MKTVVHSLSKDFETINIYVLADAHIGSPNCNYKQIKKLIDTVASEPNNFLILNGDLIDNAIIGGKSDVYTQQMTPTEQVEVAVKLLEPVKDKILCSVQGNHEARSYKTVGVDLSKLIMIELFGVQRAEELYTDKTMLLFVEFGRNYGRDNRKTIYSLYITHGFGGGSTVGSKANRLEKMSNLANADVFIHSHTHLPLVFKQAVSNIDYRNKKLNTKVALFVNTNAFLSGGSYAEVWLLKTPSIDFPHITLSGFERDVQATL